MFSLRRASAIEYFTGYIEIMKNHFRINVTDFLNDIDEAYQVVSVSCRKCDLRRN